MPVELLVPIGIFVLGIIISHSLTSAGVKLIVENQKNG